MSRKGAFFNRKCELFYSIYKTPSSRLPADLLFLSFITPSSASSPFFSQSVSSGLWLCGTQAHCRVFWANDCCSSPPSSSFPFPQSTSQCLVFYLSPQQIHLLSMLCGSLLLWCLQCSLCCSLCQNMPFLIALLINQQNNPPKKHLHIYKNKHYLIGIALST